MDTLWRLVWALPLVLLIGVAVMFVLKRFMLPMHTKTHQALRMNLCESISLSNATRVHLIEVDHQPYLIAESTPHTALQLLLPQTSEGARESRRWGLSWMQRRDGVRTR